MTTMEHAAPLVLEAPPERRRLIPKRWWAHMADIMATDADNVPVQIPMKRVFYLK